MIRKFLIGLSTSSWRSIGTTDWMALLADDRITLLSEFVVRIYKIHNQFQIHFSNDAFCCLRMAILFYFFVNFFSYKALYARQRGIVLVRPDVNLLGLEVIINFVVDRCTFEFQ